jgi:hypothetical protein
VNVSARHVTSSVAQGAVKRALDARRQGMMAPHD